MQIINDDDGGYLPANEGLQVQLSEHFKQQC